MTHQTPTKSGTLAHIRIHGVLHQKHFPHGTELIRIKQWLLTTEMRFRGAKSVRTGRFSDDAAVYLEAVKAMPTFTERKAHIDEWIEVFGERQRDSISADDIQAQLHYWKTTPREISYTRVKTDKPKRFATITLSASAINHRRTALQHLYTVLDGRSAPNPVKDVPKFREPDPKARTIRLSTVRALLRAMGRTQSQARAMVIAFTGIPHSQIKTIEPQHVDGTSVLVAGRKKGAGTQARVVPLTADGVKAFKAMKRADAWGPFSNSSLRKALRLACKAVDIDPPLTPYDLRHFFGSELYRSSGDIRATQVLMGHSTPALTHRYTIAAVDPRVQAAVASFGKRRTNSVKTLARNSKEQRGTESAGPEQKPQ